MTMYKELLRIFVISSSADEPAHRICHHHATIIVYLLCVGWEFETKIKILLIRDLVIGSLRKVLTQDFIIAAHMDEIFINES